MDPGKKESEHFPSKEEKKVKLMGRPTCFKSKHLQKCRSPGFRLRIMCGMCLKLTLVGSFPCLNIVHLEWKPTVCPINQGNGQARFASYDPLKGMDLE